jgi:Flp pilus assembly protein TadD
VIKEFSTILSLQPLNVQAHMLVGRAYEEKGQAKVARYHFDTASKQVAKMPHLVSPAFEYKNDF